MKVGIIGAGTMGSGIAQVFAMHEHDVFLCDLEIDYAKASKEKIEKALFKLAAKESFSENKVSTVLDRIIVCDKENFADCELIIEAIAEQKDLKRAIFCTMAQICHKETIFATNTSSLSLIDLNKNLPRPIIGMHFFNPAPVMKLVEIIITPDTPKDAITTIKNIALAIGKTPIEVKDSPGFVVNRILIPMINEAIGILAAGTASALDIDTAMKLGANHPLGPLALADLIGLDICLSIMQTIYEQTEDDKYLPHPLLMQMVDKGNLGRKSGQGFFTY